MIISVITGFVTLFNAGSFILLTPGKELSIYLSISVLFGTASWILLWITPSLFSFDSKQFDTMRAMQLVIVLLALIPLVSLHKSPLGLLFAFLLIAEFIFFFPAILLYEKNTQLYQAIELIRSLLNSLSLAATIIIGAGSPTFYCTLLVASTSVIGLVGLYTNKIKFYPASPSLRIGAASLKAVFPTFAVSNFVPLIASRLIEICMMQIFSVIGALGVQMCFKVGVGLAQPISSNARHLPWPQLFLVLVMSYVGGLGSLFFVASKTSLPVPNSVHFMGPTEIAAALPLVLVQFSLMLYGLRSKNNKSTTN